MLARFRGSSDVEHCGVVCMNPVLSWESDSVSESSGLRVRSAVAPVSDGDLAKEGCDSSPICISA